MAAIAASTRPELRPAIIKSVIAIHPSLVRFRIRPAGCFQPREPRTWIWTWRSTGGGRRTPKVAGSKCAPGGERRLTAEARRQDGRRPAGLDPLAVPLKQFPLCAVQAAQHHDLGAQPFHPGKGAFPVPGHAGSRWAASPVPGYLPRRVFACADFQRLEQRTAGRRFLFGRLFFGRQRVAYRVPPRWPC